VLHDRVDALLILENSPVKQDVRAIGADTNQLLYLGVGEASIRARASFVDQNRLERSVTALTQSVLA
jgi:hypothetical protein